MASRSQPKHSSSPPSTPMYSASIDEAAKVEKIVDYSFERNERSNVLAIHQTRPLIAYLINIQRTPKISKGWSGNDSIQSHQNGVQSNSGGSNNLTNQSIRIIDYDTRQRCLAKGVYHARPADCVFSINSLLCTQADIIKLAVVDRAANIYLYDLSYFINDLTATRIAVIRGPGQDVSPFENIILVWCPFVPCEDFDDGDGGLRLALATDSTIEIFAVDRLQGKAGELQRKDLKGAYKCIRDEHETNIVTLSISPDCSTISAAADSNQVTFYSSDIDDDGQRCLHNWEADIADKSPISKLFFLDDYPKLLEDSTMKFWGAALIGTRGGQILLVDLRTWTVYQKTTIKADFMSPKNFDYRIDSTSRNVVALNGNQCYIVQIELAFRNKIVPKIVRTTRLSLHNPIYSFVIKHKSDDELELFTISAYSLERYIINLKAISSEAVEDLPMSTSLADEPRPSANTPNELKRFLQQFDGSLRISSSSSVPNNTPNSDAATLLNTSISAAIPTTPGKQEAMDVFNLMHSIQTSASVHHPIACSQHSASNQPTTAGSSLSSAHQTAGAKTSGDQSNLNVAQMDRLVEALFSKLNTAFSQGLEEFLNDVKCEVSDLKLKLNGLCRDVKKLQQQLQDVSRHK